MYNPCGHLTFLELFLLSLLLKYLVFFTKSVLYRLVYLVYKLILNHRGWTVFIKGNQTISEYLTTYTQTGQANRGQLCCLGYVYWETEST